MRIVAGRWRGRSLVAPAGLSVRPTTDRVREALFGILGADVVDAEVADLCCGSGANGLEALSRGAASVTFVDSAAASLRVVRENLARLAVTPAQARVAQADAVTWLQRRLAGAQPLVIVADPPYDGTLATDLLATLASRPGPVVVAVVEHPSDRPPALPEGGAWTIQTRRYGRSSLTILRREAPAAPGEPS